MTPEEMQKRLRAYALRCIRLAGTFPRGPLGDTVGRQLIKAATSTAANYRSSCIARSRADFVHKMGIVEEEADESVFWVDFSADAGLSRRVLIADLMKEGAEILAIVVASRKTAKRRQAASIAHGPGK